MYNKLANEYEKFDSIPFQTFYENEEDVREKMTDKLNLKSNSKVLEIGGGDGRGAQLIVKRLGSEGHLYFKELSPDFLTKAFQRLEGYEEFIGYSMAIAGY